LHSQQFVADVLFFHEGLCWKYSRHISDKQFRALSLPFGNADSVNVPRDVASGRTKGYGFLEFADGDEALAAIAGLHGKDIDGQILNAREFIAGKGSLA
jgi:RNA recognition motif-containing protein